MPAKPFKRAGLHRLECPDCPSYGYFTVAMLERAGQLPTCFASGCGAAMVPTELELAMLLGVECEATDAYWAELNSVEHGQAPHGVRGRKLRDPQLIAAERVSARRRERARANRLQALRPAPEPMAF